MTKHSFLKSSVTYLLITTQLVPQLASAMEPLDIPQIQDLSTAYRVPENYVKELDQDASGHIKVDLSSFAEEGQWDLFARGQQAPLVRLTSNKGSFFLDVLTQTKNTFILTAPSRMENFIIEGNGASFLLDGDFLLQNLILNKAHTLGIRKDCRVTINDNLQGKLEEFYSEGILNFGGKAVFLVNDFILDGLCKGRTLYVKARSEIFTTGFSKLDIANQLYFDSNGEAQISGPIIFGAYKNDDEKEGIYIRGKEKLNIDARIRANAKSGINLKTNSKLKLDSKIFTTHNDAPFIVKALEAEIKGLMDLGQSLAVLAVKDIKLSGATRTPSTSLVTGGKCSISGAHVGEKGFSVQANDISILGIYKETPVFLRAEEDIVIDDRMSSKSIDSEAKNMTLKEDVETGNFRATLEKTFTNEKSLKSANHVGIKAETIKNNNVIAGKEGFLAATDKLTSNETVFSDRFVMSGQDIKLKDHNANLESLKTASLMILQKSKDGKNGVEILPGGKVRAEEVGISADGPVVNRGNLEYSQAFIETETDFVNHKLLQGGNTGIKANNVSNKGTLESKALNIEASWMYNTGIMNTVDSYLSAYVLLNTGRMHASNMFSAKTGLLINAIFNLWRPALITSGDSMSLQSVIKLNLGGIAAKNNLTSFSAVNVDLFTAARNLTSVSLFDASLLKAGQNVTNVSLYRFALPLIGINTIDISYNLHYLPGWGLSVFPVCASPLSTDALAIARNLIIGKGVQYIDAYLGIGKFLGEKNSELYNSLAKRISESYLVIKSIPECGLAKRISESYLGSYLKTIPESGLAKCISESYLVACLKSISEYGLELIGGPRGIYDGAQYLTGIALKLTPTFSDYTSFAGGCLTDGVVMTVGRTLADVAISFSGNYVPAPVKDYISELRKAIHQSSSFTNNACMIALNQKVNFGNINHQGQTYTYYISFIGNFNNSGEITAKSSTYTEGSYNNPGLIRSKTYIADFGSNPNANPGRVEGVSLDFIFDNLSPELQAKYLDMLYDPNGSIKVAEGGKIGITAINTDWVIDTPYNILNAGYSGSITADSFRLNQNFFSQGNFMLHAIKGDIENNAYFHALGKGMLLASNGKVINGHLMKGDKQLWIEGAKGVENISSVTYTNGAYAHYAKAADEIPEFSVNQGDNDDRRYQECHVDYAGIAGGTGEDLQFGDQSFEKVGLVIISGGDFDSRTGVIRSDGTNFIYASGKVKLDGFTHNHLLCDVKGNQHFFISAYVNQIKSDYGNNYIIGDMVTGDAPHFESYGKTYISSINGTTFSALPTGAHSWSSKNKQFNIKYPGVTVHSDYEDITFHSKYGDITAVNLGVETPGLFNIVAENGKFISILKADFNESTKKRRKNFLNFLGIGSHGETPNPLATYQSVIEGLNTAQNPNDTLGYAMAIYDTAMRAGVAFSQGSETISALLSGNIASAIMQNLPLNLQIGSQKTTMHMRYETHPGERTDLNCRDINFRVAEPSLIQNNIIAPGTMRLNGPKFVFSSLELHNQYHFSSSGGLIGVTFEGGGMAGAHRAWQRGEFTNYIPQIVKVGHIHFDVDHVSLNGSLFRARTISGNINQLDLEAATSSGEISGSQFKGGYGVGIEWNNFTNSYEYQLPSSIIVEDMDSDHLLGINTLNNYGGVIATNRPEQVNINRINSHTLVSSHRERSYGLSINSEILLGIPSLILGDDSYQTLSYDNERMFVNYGRYMLGCSTSVTTHIPVVGGLENQQNHYRVSNTFTYNMNATVPTQNLYDYLSTVNSYIRLGLALENSEGQANISSGIDFDNLDGNSTESTYNEMVPINQEETDDSVCAVPIVPVVVRDLPFATHASHAANSSHKELIWYVQPMSSPVPVLMDIPLHNKWYLPEDFSKLVEGDKFYELIPYKSTILGALDYLINNKGDVCDVIAVMPGDFTGFGKTADRLINLIYLSSNDDPNNPFTLYAKYLDKCYELLEEKTKKACLKIKSKFK